MHKWARMSAGVAVLGLWVAAYGQQEEPGMSDSPAAGEKQPEESKVKPTEVMRAADAAMAKARTLGFRASARGVGGLATRSPEVEAVVRAIRGKESETPGWTFLARGSTRGSDQEKASDFSTAFDGKAVRTVLEKDKQVLESDWENSKETLGAAAGWPVTWLLRWKEMVGTPFADQENPPKCRYEGEAVVDGTRCDVVYVDYSESNDPTLFDAWWYIARGDSLPRRLEMHFIDQGHGDGFIVTTLSVLEPGAPIEASALALAAPEGYEVKKIEGEKRRRAAAPRPPAGEEEEPGGLAVGAAAPDWTLKDALGKEHKLSDYKGKVVVLDFWATWCPPCRAAMPEVQKMHEDFKDKGVVVIGIDMADQGDAAKYMKENKFTYGLLLNGETVAPKYGVSGIPALFVIGQDGKVVQTAVGFGGEDAFKKTIVAAVEKAAKK